MEENLAQISETYTQGLWIVSEIFLVLALIRLYLAIRFKQNRNWLFKGKSDWFVKLTKLYFVIGLLAFLLDVPAWFIHVVQFRSAVPQGLYGFFVSVLSYICIQELILSFTYTENLQKGFVKRILFFLVSVFCGTSFILAAVIFPGTYQYPAKEECVVLEMPVKGKWLVLHGGKMKWVNYHCNYPPQLYAIDMVKLDEQEHFFKNQGDKVTDFFSFQDSVFSPSPGIVFKVEDGHETQEVYKGNDSIHPAGNHIVIQLDSNKYLFLAHLLKNSIQVKVGDTLKTGMFLALSGNSGNTSFPHLHIHIQNKPILNDSASIGQPFRFNRLNVKRFLNWSHQENAWLMRNDKFIN